MTFEDSQDLAKLKQRNRLLIGLAVSLALHLGLLFSRLDVFSSSDKSSQTAPLPLELLDQGQLQELKQRIKRAQKPKQIVNNTLQGREAKPDSTRFLGEKNQTYDRQTIAKKVDRFQEGGEGVKEGVKNPQKTKNNSKAKEVSLSDLGIGTLPKTIKQVAKNNKKLGANRGQGEGLAANNDFIDDVPLGDMTALNTQEFKYYGFYHRIRQQLEQHWGNNLREKSQELYRKGRKLATGENHITQVVVKINQAGSIIKVLVQGTSGVAELDTAAVEAFNKAGPFPNPPKGMLNKQGVATIPWGFVVKT